MKKRRLGNSNLEVSPLCFGCNVFGWTVKEPMAFALLDRLLAAGINFIDTADVYSRWVPGNHGGESETMIGNWLKLSKARDKMVICTKVGMEMGPDRKGLSKAHIFRSVEDSLQTAERLHRPVSLSQRRFSHAVRGNARCVRRINEAGQGARDRRIKSQGPTPS